MQNKAMTYLGAGTFLMAGSIICCLLQIVATALCHTDSYTLDGHGEVPLQCSAKSYRHGLTLMCCCVSSTTRRAASLPLLPMLFMSWGVHEHANMRDVQSHSSRQNSTLFLLDSYADLQIVGRGACGC